MNTGRAGSVSTSIHALVVGSSSWRETVESTLESSDRVIVEQLEQIDEADLESGDCLLTDDLSVLSDGNGIVPTVVDTGTDSDVITQALEAGATEIVSNDEIRTQAILEHRLERAVRCEPQNVDGEANCGPRCRALLGSSTELLIVLDEQRKPTFVSPAVERITGFDPTDFQDQRLDEWLHPDDVADFREAFETIRSENADRRASCECRVRHADEGWRIHDVVLRNELETDGLAGVVVSTHDVTEKSKAEYELQESFERVTDAFISLDEKREFTYVNDRAEELLDSDRSELLGRYFLEAFPELEETEFERQAIEVMKKQDPRTVEGYLERYGIWIEARLFPSESGLSIYFRDISDRVSREQTLTERTDRLETLVESVPLVLSVLDSDGTFTLSEGRGLENIGFEPGEAVGKSIFDVLSEYPAILDDVSEALDGNPVHTRRRLDGRVFDRWYRPVFDGEQLDRIIGVAVDVTERAQYEQMLSALHDATQHLLTVESKSEACEFIVDIAEDVLDLDAIVYRFDERENQLVPEAYASEIDEREGVPTRFKPKEGITWNAFVSNEPKLFDDIRESPNVYDDSTPIRGGMFIPLGEHGILNAVSTTPGAYDEEKFELAQLFGSTAEAALDRIAQTNRLREREQELKRQNDRLERIHRSSQLREDLEEHLLRVDTRNEIERGICDRLADLEECAFVWIGEPDPGGNRIVPRTSCGEGMEYLEAVTVTTHDNPATEPTGRSARNREPIHVENVASELRNGEWRTEALSRSFQSVYTVPLVYDDFIYGVLSLYGTESKAFDETTRSTLLELGETIAYAIDTVKRTKPLHNTDRTVVELEIESGSILNAIAERTDAEVRIEGALPQSDDSTIIFAGCTPPIDPTDILECPGISEASTVVETEDSTTLQFRLTDTFLGAVVEADGGSLQEFVTKDGVTRATVDIPDSIDVRELLSGINRRGLSASMIARRETSSDRSPVFGAGARNSLLNEFTDRQREVVQLAYHGGFFEWPRRITGEEVASSLDISPPAFHKHVRSAEQKLFATLFDQEITTTGVN